MLRNRHSSLPQSWRSWAKCNVIQNNVPPFCFTLAISTLAKEIKSMQKYQCSTLVTGTDLIVSLEELKEEFQDFLVKASEILISCPEFRWTVHSCVDVMAVGFGHAPFTRPLDMFPVMPDIKGKMGSCGGGPRIVISPWGARDKALKRCCLLPIYLFIILKPGPLLATSGQWISIHLSSLSNPRVAAGLRLQEEWKGYLAPTLYVFSLSVLGRWSLPFTFFSGI